MIRLRRSSHPSVWLIRRRNQPDGATVTDAIAFYRAHEFERWWPVNIAELRLLQWEIGRALKFRPGSQRLRRTRAPSRVHPHKWRCRSSTVRTPGWARVQAICDFVHRHIAFGYEHARATMTAWEVYNEGKGVCRNYAHLAIAFCRCMNIPARYCTGYLSDIGTPQPWAIGDFAGWLEAYIGGRWQMFDPRNNVPRIGRVLIAQGRDASDVPITQTFGPNTLVSFKVWTDEVA